MSHSSWNSTTIDDISAESNLKIISLNMISSHYHTNISYKYIYIEDHSERTLDQIPFVNYDNQHFPQSISSHIIQDLVHIMTASIIAFHYFQDYSPIFCLFLSILLTKTTFAQFTTTHQIQSNPQQCGDYTWCWHIDVYPSNGTITTTTANITVYDDDAETYMNVIFEPHGFPCINPTITFEYEQIDPEYYGLYLYDNGTQLFTCRGNGLGDKQCGVWWQCLTEEPINFAPSTLEIEQIDIGTQYQIKVRETARINALCDDKRTTNAHLTLSCGGTLTFPNRCYNTVRKCWPIDVYPSTTSVTTTTVNITIKDGSHSSILLYFKTHDQPCINPAITFEYQQIDNDGTNEYIMIYDNDDSVIKECGAVSSAGTECGVWRMCIEDYPLDVDQIDADTIYQMRVYEGYGVDAFCGDEISTDARFSLVCKGTSYTAIPTTPTFEPTLTPTTPTIEPTTAIPTLQPTTATPTQPTIHPSSNPTIEPTNVPTHYPTTLRYNGAVSNDYFQSEFHADISSLPQLVCDGKKWWTSPISDNMYNSKTTETNPVIYYRLNITEEMKTTYKSVLEIKTCCQFEIAGCTDPSSSWCHPYEWGVETGEYYYGWYWYYYNQDEYRWYCGDESIDTVLYLLYEKRGQVNLVESFDDVTSKTCDDTEKSAINLQQYDTGAYIIGVGGYGNDFGTFFIQLICAQYSFPVKEDELNPSISTDIPCNSSMTGDFIEQSTTYYILYHQLDITETTYLPILIDICVELDDTLMYIVKLNEVTLSYEIVSEYEFWADRIRHKYCYYKHRVMVHIDDPTQYPIGTYYIVIQPTIAKLKEAGEDLWDTKYSIKVTCADPPTQNPTTQPTSNPTFVPTNYPTVDPSPAPTFQYSFPIHKSEFIIKDNYPTIGCNTVLPNQQNTNQDIVSYYRFIVSNNMYNPSMISTCPSVYDTYLYVIEEKDSGIYVIENYESDTASCDDKSAELEISSLNNGEYYAVVQGYDNQIGNFTISLNCTDPPPKVPTELVIGLVFGLSGGFMLIFVVYYLYEWKQYRKEKGLLQNQAERSTTQIQLIQPTTAKNIQYIKVQVKEEKDDETEQDQSDVQHDQTMEPFHYRRLDGDKGIYEQIKHDENEDVIVLVLLHALQCCEDQSGLDIFQVLAIRYYDEESRKVKGIRPFKKIQWTLEFITIPPFIKTALVAFVVGISQTLGMTIVIYKLLNNYFDETVHLDELCIMDAKRWSQVYSLRILSFFLSLVVTFFVLIVINGIQHSGLYEIIDRLKPQHMQRIDGIVLSLLYIGQGINYYVCLFAVIGSYFIIFQSNKSDDYSSAGLDMILNAVALFFMLELDDQITTAQDYGDCHEHLDKVLKRYIKGRILNEYKAMNEEYIEAYMDNDGCGCHCICCNKESMERGGDQVSEIFTASCCSRFTYYTLTVFSTIVKIFCYFGGLMAPFIIFFCW